MAHFSKGKTDDITSENKLPAETSGASDTQQAGSETLPSDGTDEAGVTDAEGPETGVSDGDVTDVSETEAAGGVFLSCIYGAFERVIAHHAVFFQKVFDGLVEVIL